MKVKKESEKVGFKLNIQKTKIMASGPVTSWQINGETMADFIFGDSKITSDGGCSHDIKKQFSHSVVSGSLWPDESQHARPPCPSPTPRVYSNSCPSSRWGHPAVSSSVVPFSSCPQSLRASGSFRMRWPKYWSFSFSISPSNEHPGLISFRTDWLDLLAVEGTLKSLLQHHSSKNSFTHMHIRVLI